MARMKPRPADRPPALHYSEDPRARSAVLFDPRATEIGHWIQIDRDHVVGLGAAR